ncbi:hypothetical protein Forpe1208_v000290 [Fusarium oxysporum f. sp. rapae]|uniref:Uncharacterized protein n=1 Tax=Fusarium oxysporum f. sp. rapae TaxID=485398 RepID=A0A8J5UHG5_FUSOX|nr:hypothetical protein Forpe1208_v000290 [Fusarium oxysporum f. sp. rapae]
MPIDPDERVSELWLRRGQHESVGSEEFETLIVRTTKGRSFIPGLDSVCSFPIGETRKFRYKAIAIFPPEGPSRMFYCRAKHLWTYFAFEQTSQLGNNGNFQGVASWDQLEIEHSFPPSYHPLIDFCSFVTTSASLSDVRTITPCRGWSYPFSGEVTGLLLAYGDSRRGCIGQVRLNYLEPPLPVYSNSFWLGFLDDDDDGSDEWLPWHMNFISFCLSEPVPNEETKYIEIPFGGRLEWAVFGFTIAARHVEEGEPCDGIGQVMAGRNGVLDYASPNIKTFAVPIRVRETGS